MRAIFTDGHKEFMCMQSSKRSSNSFPRSVRQIITSNFDSFFFSLPTPSFCYRGLCCSTGQRVIMKWYGFASCCAMNSERNWCLSHTLWDATFFFFFPPQCSYVLGSNSSVFTSFIVSPDRILRLLLHVLQVKPIRQESYCLHSHFGFKSSFLL